MNAAKRNRKVEKEELKTCSFEKPDIALTDAELAERNRRLYLAMLMGNNYESKVKLVFNTNTGGCEIVTVIWATTEKYVLLKGGNSIPLEAIAKVEMDNSQQNAHRIF